MTLTELIDRVLELDTEPIVGTSQEVFLRTNGHCCYWRTAAVKLAKIVRLFNFEPKTSLCVDSMLRIVGPKERNELDSFVQELAKDTKESIQNILDEK